MKIQIIYLDPQDDHASARDKLNACQAQRVALVWPKRGRILTRRLDLVLLDRHARHRGVQVGLVTLDPPVRRNAESIGIPVFETIDAATRETWRTRGPIDLSARERDRSQVRETLLEGSRRESPPSLGSVGRAMLALLGLLAVLALALALLPSAGIVVQPDFETQLIERTITLDPAIAASTTGQSLPASLESVTLLGSLSRSTSTTISVPTEYAAGSVEFTNLTSDPVTIPSGTGVRTTDQPAIRFETITVATLEADETVIVDVRAMEPGLAGNVPAGAILAVEGLLGLEVSVSNPEPLSGGKEEQRLAVSEDDLAQLLEDLTASLLEEAESAMAADLASNQVMVPESLDIARVIRQLYDHQVGEPGKTVELTLELEITALTYDREALEDRLQQVMQAELPEGMHSIPDTIEISHVGEAQLGADGRYVLGIVASQRLYQAVDLGALAAEVQWRTTQQARLILEVQYGLTVQQISIRPAWFPRLPMTAARIAILWEWEAP